MSYQQPTQTIIDRDASQLRGSPSRQLGYGASPTGYERNGRKYGSREAMIGMVKALCTTPSTAAPAIESVNTLFGGPPVQSSISQSFGATINQLTPSPMVGSTNQYSTMAQVGEFQTYFICTAIQWRMDVEPINFVEKGNSIPITQTTKPVSPDAFVTAVNGGAASASDVAAAGALGLTGASTMSQAILEWGTWQDLAAYFMARAYKLQWNYGQHTLFLNEDLRYTMFVPSNAQNGSAGSSEIDSIYPVRETNSYYQSVLASQSQFIKIDRSRYGNDTLGGTAGLSVFHPSRAYETLGVTYGGSASRALLAGNTEWKRLCCPILIGPGIPLGVVAQLASTDYAGAMQQWLSPSFNIGTTSPVDLTESSTINAGNSVAGSPNVTGVELSLDTASTLANSLQVPVDRVIYKGGRWSLTLGFKGAELTPDQAQTFKDPSVRQMISANTGLMISPKQLWNA